MAPHFLEKWKQGLSRTRQGLGKRLVRFLSEEDPAAAARIEELEAGLIEADVGVAMTERLIEVVRPSFGRPGAAGREAVRSALKEAVRSFLDPDGAQAGGTAPQVAFLSEKPWVILVVGVNGTGKTTTIGKLARRFRREGKTVLLAAADTFRAAAGEQLDVWAERSGARLIRQAPGADPASVAYDALDHAARHCVDVLLVDTAGRLHTKQNLMEELKKIRRVLSKRMPSAPHETLLVLDATTGQNGLRQARIFTEAAGVTGIVLTKLDGTAKGGMVLAIRQETGIPVRWAGAGEEVDDLLPFDAEAFAEGLFG